MTIPGDSPWSGKTLRLGSRGSRLALAQTEWTARRLEALHPGLRCQIAIVQTTGDKILDSPLALIGGKGVFTKEIEIALLRQEIDLAVHSLKDLPVAQPEGLRLAAVSRREFPGDVLIARQPLDWKSLGPECTVGTSSQRRRAQLALGNPRIHIVDLRGNVPTRIQRVADGELDAIVLARAGIQRLGISGLWMEDLDFDSMLPAPGQGALGFQIRQDDAAAAEIVSALHDEIAWAECAAERTFLAALGGGCQAPIGALGQCDGQRLRLAGLVAALDGRECYRSQTEGPAGQPETIGKQLARLLLEGGAKLLIQRLALSETVEGYENAVSRARTMDAGKPLAGKRVLVTRDEDTDGPLCSALRLYGAEPVVAPLIEESPPANSAPLIECARQADNYDWIVFSSRRAVQAFAEAMRMAGHSFNGIKARIACVGPQTAKTILEAGGRVDRMPDMPGAAGLIEKLRVEKRISGSKVLYPCAANARPELKEGLREIGCELSAPIAYETRSAADSLVVRQLLLNGRCAAATFASPSAVEALVEAIGRDMACEFASAMPCFAIGPTTAAAMRRLGMEVAAEAADRTFEGLAKLVAEQFARNE